MRPTRSRLCSTGVGAAVAVTGAGAAGAVTIGGAAAASAVATGRTRAAGGVADRRLPRLTDESRPRQRPVFLCIQIVCSYRSAVLTADEQVVPTLFRVL